MIENDGTRGGNRVGVMTKVAAGAGVAGGTAEGYLIRRGGA